MEAPGFANEAAPTFTWRKALSILGTIIAVLTVGFFGMGFAATGLSPDFQSWADAWHLAGFVAAPAAAALMIWRMKFPVPVFVAATALVILLPLSPFGPAIALTWAISRGSPRTWAWVIPVGAVGVAIPFVREWRTGGQVFADSATGEALFELPGLVVTALLLFFLALAGGWVRFFAARAAAESAAAAATQGRAERLQSQLDRQAERDLIAREMHDTVAHHLSLVSLQAGALEVTSTEEAVLPAAKAVRESAHRAVEEMRALISSLREDESPLSETATLQRWEELVAGAKRAGIQVESQVTGDLSQLPPPLGRAGYRILQESLTNATKHGKGSGVGVLLNAQPGEGLFIGVSNWLPAGSPLVPIGHKSGGSGIVGMSERTSTLGGTLSAGPEENRWVVKAWIPWT